jgi:hypothetical protein
VPACLPNLIKIGKIIPLVVVEVASSTSKAVDHLITVFVISTGLMILLRIRLRLHLKNSLIF